MNYTVLDQPLPTKEHIQNFSGVIGMSPKSLIIDTTAQNKNTLDKKSVIEGREYDNTQKGYRLSDDFFDGKQSKCPIHFPEEIKDVFLKFFQDNGKHMCGGTAQPKINLSVSHKCITTNNKVSWVLQDCTCRPHHCSLCVYDSEWSLGGDHW